MDFKDLEIKLARTKEDIDDVERQFKAAKEDRENTAIQLQKMQEEFRAMTDDRDQNLERWEMTVAQAESCLRQLEKSRSVNIHKIIFRFKYKANYIVANAGLSRCKRVGQRGSKST